MIVSYEYLERMFSRLQEARELRANVGKQVTDNAERMMAENLVCCCEASIRDYLKYHAQEPKA